MLSSLRPGMSEPEVVRCGDGFYRRVIYGMGPYIADYPEQVLISGIVQGWCPKYVSLLLHMYPWPLTRTFPLCCRCTSIDLESPGVPRSREFTESLEENLGLGDLWNLYGIVGGVEVGAFFLLID